MDRASDFELCVGGVYPVFGGKLRLSTKSTGLAARLIVQICPAKNSYLLEPTHLF